MGVRQAELSDSRILSAVAFVCSAAVLLAAVVATLTIAGGGAEIVRLPFRLMCHGQVDRAFEMAGIAMPLCARCVGIYAGIAVAAVAMFTAPPARRRQSWFVLGAALVAPMVIDGSGQTMGLWSTGNAARAVTGLAFGLGLVMLAINGVASRRDRDLGPGSAGMPEVPHHGSY